MLLRGEIYVGILECLFDGCAQDREDSSGAKGEFC